MKTQNLPSGERASSGFNYQMCLLSVIGISFVVFGHINFASNNYDPAPLGSLYAWFPYYSFHLPIFLFITGYFFRDFSQTDAVHCKRSKQLARDSSSAPGNPCDSQEQSSFLRSFAGFLLKKARTMLLPFYLISGLFLLADNVLLSWGITYLTPFSLTEWLLHPWTNCYSITYSLPIWYLTALFLAEIYYVLLRKLCSLFLHDERAKEITLLIVTLAIGILCVYIKNTAHPSETVTVYLRSAVMLFYIQVGRTYRTLLEKMDRLPSGWYFFLLFAVQFLIILLSGNANLSPGLYALVNFDTFGLNYFLAGLTGIAFWLRITRLVAQIPRRSRLLTFIGNNTKYIMSFHVFGFFLLNALFSLIYRTDLFKPLLDGFSVRTWKSYLYYALTTNPRLTLLYFFAGMGVPLLIALLIAKVKQTITHIAGTHSGNGHNAA